MSELVRRRVSGETHGVDERLLGELVRTLREGTRRAEAALDRGIERAERALAELRDVRSADGTRADAVPGREKRRSAAR